MSYVVCDALDAVHPWWVKDLSYIVLAYADVPLSPPPTWPLFCNLELKLRVTLHSTRISRAPDALCLHI